jgi:hypothetical protein
MDEIKEAGLVMVEMWGIKERETFLVILRFLAFMVQ